MLNSDNWMEIMTHLDISLPSLILTCKLIYRCYLENKKLLCNEGNYRFSPYQHQLSHDITTHMDKNYNEKLPLLLQTNNNIGTKASILSSCMKYKGTVVIMTHKKDNVKWKKEINQLYNNKILICANLYCDRRLIQYGYTHDCDPNLLGYKVVIVNKGNVWEIAKHSIVVVYKINKELGRLSNNAILFNGRVKIKPVSRPALAACDYIEYPHIKPILIMKDLCCYHEGKEILSPINHDHLYKPLNERLDDIITNIVSYYEGPYLIIGENINTSHPLKQNDLRSNDIKFMTFKYFKNNLCSKIKTVIILWPGHTKNNVYDILEQFNTFKLNVFNIHSTIEEKYLRFVDKTPKTYHRKNINFLTIVRDLSKHYDLDKLPSTIYTLLMYEKDLSKVYKLINI